MSQYDYLFTHLFIFHLFTYLFIFHLFIYSSLFFHLFFIYYYYYHYIIIIIIIIFYLFITYFIYLLFRKPEMEDKVIVVPEVSGRPLWSFFGVCDGHGGDFVASYLSMHLSKIVGNVSKEISKEMEKEMGKEIESEQKQEQKQDLEQEFGLKLRISSGGGGSGGDDEDEKTTPKILSNVLLRSCFIADKEISKQRRMAVEINQENGNITCKDSSGSTANLCLISKNYIVVGNVGDSRALLAKINPINSTLTPPMDSPIRDIGENIPQNIPKNVLLATAMSVDHKFSIETEKIRAEEAGAE